MIGLALLGGIPVEPHLNRRVRAVGAGFDFDLVRPGCQFNSAAHIVESVGGGNGVVLICLQNVAVNCALEYTGAGQMLAVNRDRGVGAQRLKIYPVNAGVRRSQRPFPGDSRVGGECVAGGEIELGVGLLAS